MEHPETNRAFFDAVDLLETKVAEVKTRVERAARHLPLRDEQRAHLETLLLQARAAAQQGKDNLDIRAPIQYIADLERDRIKHWPLEYWAIDFHNRLMIAYHEQHLPPKEDADTDLKQVNLCFVRFDSANRHLNAIESLLRKGRASAALHMLFRAMEEVRFAHDYALTCFDHSPRVKAAIATLLDPVAEDCLLNVLRNRLDYVKGWIEDNTHQLEQGRGQ